MLCISDSFPVYFLPRSSNFQAHSIFCNYFFSSWPGDYETSDRGNLFPTTVRHVVSKMADRAERGPSTNNFSLAINLLRQATDILSSSESSENENNSSSSTPATPSSSSARSQNTIPLGPTPDHDAAIIADFRNLFFTVCGFC